MRTINDHRVNAANDRIGIEAIDEPGPDGASHEYLVTLPPADLTASTPKSWQISFQKGPINVAGVNGLTHEVLLAIVADRLRSLQSGPFGCRENALALTKIEEAQQWLNHRTRVRLARGVEGTYKI